MKNIFNNSLRRLDFKFPYSNYYIPISRGFYEFKFNLTSTYIYNSFSSSSFLPSNKTTWLSKVVEPSQSDPSYVSISTINEFLKSLEFGRVNEFLFYGLVYTDKGFLSICKGFVINRYTTPLFIQEKIVLGINKLMERYEFTTIEFIIFKYRDVISSRTQSPQINDQQPLKGITVDRINRAYLSNKYAPLRSEVCYWGDLYKSEGNTNFFHYSNTYDLIRTYLGDGQYNVSVVLKDTGEKLFEFNDQISDDSVIRNIENYRIHIKDGRVIKVNIKHHSKFIPLAKSDYILQKEMKNLITFDIEAYLDSNGLFVPYACGWYIDDKLSLYLLKDFESPQDMIQKAFLDILNNKQYNHFNVYVHNNKNFDAYFIIKALLGKFSVDPLFRDGKIIAIKVVDKKGRRDAVRIQIIDSYMLLPASLDKLSKAFQCPVKKEIFPYNFVTAQTLNYRGGGEYTPL